MTDREKAIITAYTGITMLTGEKFSIFHKYIEDLLGRPVWTHELATKAVWNEIKEKSKPDFLKLCADEIDNAPTVEPPEWQYEWLKRMVEEVVRPKGEWEEITTNPPEFLGHRFYICSKCGREIDVMTPDESLDDYPYCHCGARMIKGAENE